MLSKTLLCLTTLVVASAMAQNAECPRCLSNQRCDFIYGVPTCVSEYACYNGQCDKKDQTCQDLNNEKLCADDCAKVECRGESKCVLKQRRCDDGYCPPVAVCKQCPRCVSGTRCDLINGVPTCVSEFACHNGKCDNPKQTCKVFGNEKLCADDCNKIECGSGERCELKQYQGIDSYVPPVAECEQVSAEATSML
jgi:hypothetical protein